MRWITFYYFFFAALLFFCGFLTPIRAAFGAPSILSAFVCCAPAEKAERRLRLRLRRKSCPPHIAEGVCGQACRCPFQSHAETKLLKRQISPPYGAALMFFSGVLRPQDKLHSRPLRAPLLLHAVRGEVRPVPSLPRPHHPENQDHRRVTRGGDISQKRERNVEERRLAVHSDCLVSHTPAPFWTRREYLLAGPVVRGVQTGGNSVFHAVLVLGADSVKFFRLPGVFCCSSSV